MRREEEEERGRRRENFYLRRAGRYVLSCPRKAAVGINRLSCTKDTRVITFVTWRYVALRTFTLPRCTAMHRSAARSLGQRNRKKGLRSKKKKKAVARQKSLLDKATEWRAKGWDRKRLKGRGERGGRTESPRVFCFAAFSRNFYDYRLCRVALQLG